MASARPVRVGALAACTVGPRLIRAAAFAVGRSARRALAVRRSHWIPSDVEVRRPLHRRTARLLVGLLHLLRMPHLLVLPVRRAGRAVVGLLHLLRLLHLLVLQIITVAATGRCAPARSFLCSQRGGRVDSVVMLRAGYVLARVVIVAHAGVVELGFGHGFYVCGR